MKKDKELKDLYAVLVKCSNVDYDKKSASKLILSIKHCKNDRKIQEMKYLLYKKSAKFLIKAINNFWKLVETMPAEKVLHTNVDIALECWSIFDRCVQNIVIKDHGKYGFYLNTSLNRGIYRLYEKHYMKHFDVINNQEVSEYNLSIAQSSHTLADLTDIDLSLNFTEVEISIIHFKISGEKLMVFLKEQAMNKIDYTEHLENIKTKMLQLYKTPEEYDNYQ